MFDEILFRRGRRQPALREASDRLDGIRLGQPLQGAPRALRIVEDVLGVVRVNRRPPIADDERLHETPGNEVDKHLEFLGFQGVVAAEAGGHLLDDVDGFCVSEYLVADCYRQIGNERSVHHVAEVDDAGDVLTLGEQVLRVEVVVYHLCPHAGKPRSDQGIKSIQPQLIECTARLLQVIELVAQCTEMRQVPQQHSSCGRMEESSQ